ncbi:MAG: AEC family transporter [Clostridiales bacterium]|nr:AEC family transporter [Clostridiales bacterium]
MIDNFLFSLSSALPIFFVMIIGYYLKRRAIINEQFVKAANMLVFNVALPVKIFSDVYSTSFEEYFDIRFVMFIIIGTIVSVMISWVTGALLIKDRNKLGAFIQGSFRGNFLYIGLSLMENVTGSIGLKAPLVIALIIPLYNILAIVVLSFLEVDRQSNVNLRGIVKNIVGNPMIIAVVLGMVVSQFGLNLPLIMTRTMSYFEVVATPLALIAIGASFKFGNMKGNLNTALLASSLKLILLPALAVISAIALGFGNEDVFLIYILFGVPTATISYVVTVVMKGDHDLASNIIMVSTLLSNVSMTLYVFIFKTMGYLN